MAGSYNAGIVTAYGAAVRGGYTGTYEQFCAQQANYAQTAAAVEQAKTDAQAAVQQAQDIADSIPEDYSQLSEDVSNLKEDLGYPNTISVSDSSINSSTGLWQNASGNSFTVISISPDQTLKIQRNTDHAFLYCLLSDYTGADIGNSPSYATGFSKPVTVSSTTLTDIAIPNDARYLWLYNGYTGADFFPKEILIDSVSYFDSVHESNGKINRELDDINNELATKTSDIAILKTDVDVLKNSPSYDVAVGDMFETATTNDVNTGYIKSVRCDKRQKRDYLNRNIVAVNHDDLQPSDYLATRKIYNKFGFKANFNFILLPFTSKAQQESMIENVKALVADGHDLGLHAIMGASFWWMNKMFDVHPNFTTSFMPTLDELKTVDGNNKNVFGYTVGANTVFSDIGYTNPPSNVSSVKVLNATATDLIYLNVNYCLYTMFINTVSGLDLDGNSQNWTGLRWLEYWYNELIDDTLGYSNNSQSLEANFIADYAVPSGTTQSASAYNAYYPDATHLLNGKMVRFDDTTNPHYSDPSYQKAGYFTKGLFKGSVSCCNYEVIDRCIDIAKAFCKHYFGVDKFTNFGRHGVRYVDSTWKDSYSVPYDNRDKTVLTGEVGKFYHSRSGKFITEHDILLDKGIMMTNHYHPLNPIFESEIGLYYGQHGIRYPFFNHIYKDSGDINYLAFFGTSATGVSETMDYSTFISYMDGRDNWLKFAYETAGQTFTKPDGTGSMYMFNNLNNIINHIRATRGTGKIPVLSLDTIKLNAATMAGIELLCQYCYANGIEIVPMEKARVLAESFDREPLDNYFPNPGFNQSVLNLFGGESTSMDAYMPDGWFMNYLSGNAEYVVDKQTVDGNTERVFTISTTGNSDYLYFQSRVYGLPAGTYHFSIWAKQEKTKGKINIYKKKNSDYIERYYGSDDHIKYYADETFTPASEWTEYTADIVIPEHHRNMPDSSVASQYSKGYEDNVCNITFEIYIGSETGGNSVSIAIPKLKLS